MISKKEKWIAVIEEILSDLENPKVSLLNCINKLNRASKLLDEKDILIWTEIQLGNITYTLPLTEWIEAYVANEKKKHQGIKQKP